MACTKTYKIKQKNEEGQDVVVFDITVIVDNPNNFDDYVWDSKTGQVLARLGNGPWECVPFTTTTQFVGALEPKEFTTENILSMEYDYLYY
jgi:hypothetical protein